MISIATEGRALPSFTGHETWTIEYSPMILASAIGAVMAFIGLKKNKKKIWCYSAATFNAVMGVFFICAVIYLWGEKF
jgi:hypothetical protein